MNKDTGECRAFGNPEDLKQFLKKNREWEPINKMPKEGCYLCKGKGSILGGNKFKPCKCTR